MGQLEQNSSFEEKILYLRKLHDDHYTNGRYSESRLVREVIAELVYLHKEELTRLPKELRMWAEALAYDTKSVWR